MDYYCISPINIHKDIQTYIITDTVGNKIQVDSSIIDLLIAANEIPLKSDLISFLKEKSNFSEEEIKNAFNELFHLGFIYESNYPEKRFNSNIKKALRIIETFSSICECTIAITSKCNYKCSFCNSHYNGNEKIEIDISDLKRILEELSIIGCSRIILTGGETFLHSECDKLLEIIKESVENLGYNKFVFGTNGAFIRKYGEHISKFSDYISFQYSYHANGELGDEIFGISGAADKVIEAIKFSISRKINTIINIVVTDDNFEYLNIIVDSISKEDFINNEYFKGVRFAPCLPFGRAKNKSLPPLKVKAVSELALELNQKKTFNVRCTFNETLEDMQEDRLFCSACIYSIFINTDLSIFPCGNWSYSKIGNAKESIINELNRSKLHKMFVNGRNVKPNWECKDCSCRIYCVKNCLAIYKVVSHSYNKNNNCIMKLKSC